MSRNNDRVKVAEVHSGFRVPIEFFIHSKADRYFPMPLAVWVWIVLPGCKSRLVEPEKAGDIVERDAMQIAKKPSGGDVGKTLARGLG